MIFLDQIIHISIQFQNFKYVLSNNKVQKLIEYYVKLIG